MNIASEFLGENSVFAKRLTELMKNNGITQQKLAAAIGTTRQAVAQYMDGIVLPNIDKLYKIAIAFNVSADYLLGISNSQTPDINDRQIHELLGLSDKAIAELKEEVALFRGNPPQLSTDEALKRFAVDYYPSANAINILLEEKKSPQYRTVLELLSSIFLHIKEPNGEFGFVKYVCVDQNTVEEEPIKNDMDILTDDEVFSVRLFLLQKAVKRLKDEIDKRETE